ncbi:MAG: NADH-quinone oxidoreductase subunit L [Armatimonadota bacterium]
MLELTWLIPLLPALAFVVIIAYGRKLPGEGAYIAILAIFASLGLTFALAIGWFFGGLEHHYHGLFSKSIEWMPAGKTPIETGYCVDSVTIMMLIVVTVVTTMVQIFSIGYMHGDKRYPRFFAYLSLFASAMLTLVIANNLILMFMSWELVGLTSYLLIGFWFEKPSAMRAAKKAFLVTRVGDVGFLAGLILLYLQIGSLNLFGEHGIFENLNQIQGMVQIGPWAISIVALAGLLLFCGAIGKSAQFPLHVWLPDAMEGPTPVSALIHAATMVAAGVYLVARMYPVYLFDDSHVALNIVAYVGAFTALFAATIGIAQNDIKRVLAYSTLSQLGYMIMALGVFGYVAALFHLMTHAFFKAQLFLGSGSVIHGTGTQDIREMGGLKKKMPVTYWSFLIATLSLCGIPFITAGGFSKEEILLIAFHTNKIVFWVGVLGAFLTSFYMFRLVHKTFHGEPRNKKIQAHESSNVMLVPLIILAVLAISAGWVGTPWANWFEHHIIGVLGHHEELMPHLPHGFSLTVFLIATCSAIAGIAFATIIWWKPGVDLSRFNVTPFKQIAKIVENKYYIDEIYNATIIRLLMIFAAIMYWFDRWIIDYLIVNGTGYMSVLLSKAWGWFDKTIIDGLVNLSAFICGFAGKYLKYFQTGMIQQYVFLMIAAIIIISLTALVGNITEESWVSWARLFYR